MPETLAFTRITHSCHLIEFGDMKLLTDPWFSERPFYHPGEPLAMCVDELPHLDAVLITHDHFDHCDLGALAAYRDRSVPLVVAAPVARRASAAGFSDVRPLEPWETTTVGDLSITAAPGKHAVYELAPECQVRVVSPGERVVVTAGE